MAQEPKNVSAVKANGKEVIINLAERMPEDHAEYGGFPRYSMPNQKGEVMDRTTKSFLTVPSLAKKAA